MPIQISSFSKVPSFLFVIDYCFAACYSIMSERGAFMDEIEIIKQKLIEQVNPICIYLFGSFEEVPLMWRATLTFILL